MARTRKTSHPARARERGGSRWVVGIWVVGIVAVAGGGPALSWMFWEDLRGGQVRNAALVIGGATALLLAVWRSRVAERQAKAAQSQVKASQQSLSNERYQKGAEMLGSDVRSVRLGGVYALERLAEEHPEQYHLQVMRLLCAFARNPINDDTIETESPETPDDPARPSKRLRDDVQAVIEAIGSRSEAALDFERKEAAKLHPDAEPADREKQFRQRLLKLDGADLSGGSYWEKMNLSSASLSRADLSGSEFLDGVDLSYTALNETDLSGTQIALLEVKFSGASLKETNLSNATFRADFTVFTDLTGSNVEAALAHHVNLSSTNIVSAGKNRGPTQHQIDIGCFWANPPPHGIDRCAETGKPLIWKPHPETN